MVFVAVAAVAAVAVVAVVVSVVAVVVVVVAVVAGVVLLLGGGLVGCQVEVICRSFCLFCFLTILLPLLSCLLRFCAFASSQDPREAGKSR